MPKFLLQRCGDDSIRSFRSAASLRFADGVEAARAERRTAAIYLWAYVAEMLIKSAYFKAIGFRETQVIRFVDLNDARNRAILSPYHITWPGVGKFHNVRAWCDYLVAYRSRPPGIPYADPGFGGEIKRRGLQIEPIWRETLRYHGNLAYTLTKSSACGVRSPGLFAIPWTSDPEPSCHAIDSAPDHSLPNRKPT